MASRSLFLLFAGLSLLAVACGSPAQPQAKVPPTTAEPAPTTTAAEERPPPAPEIAAAIDGLATGLGQFNSDVVALNQASDYQLSEDLSVELALRSCSAFRSTGGADVDLLGLHGLLAASVSDVGGVSPFTLEMSNFVQGFLASAATNICDAEAEAVFNQSREQFARFTDGEYRFLLALHGPDDDSIQAREDADLLQEGYAVCGEYTKADSAELVERFLVSYAEEDLVRQLSLLYAGDLGSLCPEFSDTTDAMLDQLNESPPS